jgi:hypothetical protein
MILKFPHVGASAFDIRSESLKEYTMNIGLLHPPKMCPHSTIIIGTEQIIITSKLANMIFFLQLRSLGPEINHTVIPRERFLGMHFKMCPADPGAIVRSGEPALITREDTVEECFCLAGSEGET